MTLKMKLTDKDVLESSRERIEEMYRRFDTVVVSFSGGKDSTTCLNLCLEEAEKLGKLPQKTYFYDEECIHPETIAYVERVRNDPRIDLRWMCLPIKHRNACSQAEPWWHPWDPAKRDLWVRELPEGAETTAPWFNMEMTIADCAFKMYGFRKHGMVADVRGIRADESMRGELCFIKGKPTTG
jgi:predicted phosphoadenosine phosphosulfate sulfurtransferase